MRAFNFEFVKLKAVFQCSPGRRASGLQTTCELVCMIQLHTQKSHIWRQVCQQAVNKLCSLCLSVANKYEKTY